MDTSYEKTKGHSEWLTPPEIIQALGPFDLDPCAPVNPPWRTARVMYSEKGLELPWFGRIWLNPPYGKEVSEWMRKMQGHTGIALVFSRTDTVWFQRDVLPYAKSAYWLKGRLRFCTIDGRPYHHNAGAPSVLLSYSEYDVHTLESAGLAGYHISLEQVCFITMEEGTWRELVRRTLVAVSEGKLENIYRHVRKSFPRKVTGNKHYKAKIRQTLQYHFERTGKGIYKIPEA